MATIAQIQDKIDLRIDGGDNPISSERELWELFLSQQFIGEIKFIKMDVGDLASYFVTTGGTKGLGLTGTVYEGWAWCNGNNGTTNDDGKVSIAYGTNNSTLGATGGSTDAVVVAHTHGLPADIMIYEGTPTALNLQGGSLGVTLVSAETTTSTGVSATNANMQPYVVELKIQRIA